ncbi:molybdopterin molybdotransferase MoeA [Chromohalobacter israelensis]|uniref:Molybdopterin molybdenumtransferase n=1 Tax=Chromohalobacter israelensis (strain ATCC BAA-138 / DSM 3043 / CIP 106854 / NCIMB 13768 / 1H11) TaxID=290398 RepID=Q1QW86_CHRI1|nr:gephyrin-like molybdotransferase Glp [Chromohalobacter salexigens]ABE59272.1 molybdopterin molybdochelatase [Chromohalobacter salexigens DSM 3043]NWO56674.1 molybdopterin molybdenumtransferase MoeA [Chromohalobacter salexigens]
MAELQSVERALSALLDGVSPSEPEWIDCTQAAGRVLAETVTARLDVPPADNSAMDGYALRHADAGQALPVSQRVAAGHAPEPLASGTCARIFTGGEIPPGADTVVMQERVTMHEQLAIIPDDIECGDNVRRRGRDVRASTPLLEAGTRLEAAALGHLAGQGITQVAVHRRPRIALLSTGDEIVEPGQTLAPGQIHNSNRPMLSRLLERFGADLVMREHVADDFATTQRLLGDAAACADIIVTTGGVSVGEEDHVKHALESLGRLDLWQLAMRPGKPLALGRIGETRVVGLPGNPVSCFVGAWVYLRPLIGAFLACPRMATLPRLWARADFETRTQARRHYMRVGLEFTPEGVIAHAFADQNSAVLSSCLEADALAVIPEHTTVRAGEQVECLWLTE